MKGGVYLLESSRKSLVSRMLNFTDTRALAPHYRGVTGGNISAMLHAAV